MMLMLLLLLSLFLLAPTLRRTREDRYAVCVNFYSITCTIGMAVVSRRCVQGNMRPGGEPGGGGLFGMRYERIAAFLADPGFTTIVDRNERLATLAFVI